MRINSRVAVGAAAAVVITSVVEVTVADEPLDLLVEDAGASEVELLSDGTIVGWAVAEDTSLSAGVKKCRQ